MGAWETLREPRRASSADRAIDRIVELVRAELEADESTATWSEHDERRVSLLASCIVSELDDQPRELVDAAALTADLEMVFQPVFTLDSGEVVAFEALARFPTHPGRTTQEWFTSPVDADEGVALELAAVRAAVERLDELPDGVLLSLNVSAAAVMTRRFAELAAPVADRLIIELTEHEPVDDYQPVAAALTRLRQQGARLAIDDVGAGYASFRHILQLAPDIVKLDLSLTRQIESDLGRRALTTALVRFAEVIGSTLAAEGIESAGELAMLRELGVVQGQGFYLGYPLPLEERFH
jgi:EAL domain-containing protein (putative c-di-GMP-specific phosphodiesterase class I)